MLAALLVVTGSVQAAETRPGTEATRLQRLVKVAELWGEVKFRHPGLAASDLDWDAALIATLPQVEATGDSAAYRAVVQALLARLGDPVSRVKTAQDAVSPLARAPHPFRRWVRGETLVLHYAALAGSQAWTLFQKEEAALKEDLSRAKHVIVDARLRSTTDSQSELYFTWETLKVLHSFLIDAPLAVPGERQVLHSGYSGGPSSGSFYTGFLSEADRVVSPRPAPRPRRLTFLVDQRSLELPTMMALRSLGKARVVAEGPVTDEVQVSTMELDLGEGVTVQLRTSELGQPLAFDATVPARTGKETRDAALERALQLGARPLARPKLGGRAALPPAARAAAAGRPFPGAPRLPLTRLTVGPTSHLPSPPGKGRGQRPPGEPSASRASTPGSERSDRGFVEHALGALVRVRLEPPHAALLHHPQRRVVVRGSEGEDAPARQGVCGQRLARPAEQAPQCL